jgi:hypothetical protein
LILPLVFSVIRALGGACATSYTDNVAYTPAWQQMITGVAAEKAIAVARDFAHNAEKTGGRSMVIIGAGMKQRGTGLPSASKREWKSRLCGSASRSWPVRRQSLAWNWQA